MMRVARAAVGAIGSLALFATIIGSLGGVFWGFDMLANFRLQYLVVLGITATALGFLGAGRTAVLLTAGALFNAILIAPLYLGSQPSPAGDDRLEIVSFNTQLSNPRRQLDWILAQDPDLVLLLESSRIAEEVMAELDIGYQVTSGIPPGRNYGPTVLTRNGVPVQRLPFATAGGDALRVEVNLGDEKVAVYGIHPPSPSNPWRTTARNDFMKAAGEAAAAEELPVIVVGDFNATPWSEGFRLVTGPGDLANSQAGYGYGSTWPAQLWPVLRIPIDHLVYGNGLTVVDREVGPTLSADHRPIRVVLARAEEGLETD